jgi:isoleucyl-tRNA synthetase
VIFRATPQWFISMDNEAQNGEKISLRENALSEVEK